MKKERRLLFGNLLRFISLFRLFLLVFLLFFVVTSTTSARIATATSNFYRTKTTITAVMVVFATGNVAFNTIIFHFHISFTRIINITKFFIQFYNFFAKSNTSLTNFCLSIPFFTVFTLLKSKLS